MSNTTFGKRQYSGLILFEQRVIKKRYQYVHQLDRELPDRCIDLVRDKMLTPAERAGYAVWAQTPPIVLNCNMTRFELAQKIYPLYVRG